MLKLSRNNFSIHAVTISMTLNPHPCSQYGFTMLVGQSAVDNQPGRPSLNLPFQNLLTGTTLFFYFSSPSSLLYILLGLQVDISFDASISVNKSHTLHYRSNTCKANFKSITLTAAAFPFILIRPLANSPLIRRKQKHFHFLH